MSGFETEGLDDFIDAMDLIQRNYPTEIKKLMQSEGNKLKNRTIKTAKSSVGKKTGNYLKGIKRGKYYKYRENGADSIRVYAGRPANHGHLIEEGHEMVSHKPDKESLGNVKGYHIFSVSADIFESTYEDDCEKFADKITKSLD